MGVANCKNEGTHSDQLRIIWEKLGDVSCLCQVDYVAIKLVFL